MIANVALLASFGLVLGALLGLAAKYWRPADDPLVDRIDALLPQSQCAQCGEPGCLPFARALAGGRAALDGCPPGGERLTAQLAQLLGRASDDARIERSLPVLPLARIDEARCIGCTLCLPACPVDAIVGAQRLMHTVVDDECTGCGLCLPVCPVDCIALVAPVAGPERWSWPAPQTDGVPDGTTTIAHLEGATA